MAGAGAGVLVEEAPKLKLPAWAGAGAGVDAGVEEAVAGAAAAGGVLPKLNAPDGAAAGAVVDVAPPPNENVELAAAGGFERVPKSPTPLVAGAADGALLEDAGAGAAAPKEKVGVAAGAAVEAPKLNVDCVPFLSPPPKVDMLTRIYQYLLGKRSSAVGL